MSRPPSAKRVVCCAVGAALPCGDWWVSSIPHRAQWVALALSCAASGRSALRLRYCTRWQVRQRVVVVGVPQPRQRRLPTLGLVVFEPHVGVAADRIVGHTVRAVHRRVRSRGLYRTRFRRERTYHTLLCHVCDTAAFALITRPAHSSTDGVAGACGVHAAVAAQRTHRRISVPCEVGVLTDECVDPGLCPAELGEYGVEGVGGVGQVVDLAGFGLAELRCQLAGGVRDGRAVAAGAVIRRPMQRTRQQPGFDLFVHRPIRSDGLSHTDNRGHGSGCVHACSWVASTLMNISPCDA